MDYLHSKHAAGGMPPAPRGARTAEEFRVEVRRLRLAGLRFRAAAPLPGEYPVLALHGWLDNARSFDPLAAAFGASDWYSLDFPGHGYSDHRPAGCFYHFADYVADVLGVIDALGHEQVTLVGHSLGAGVASLFAAAFPERVAHLVMIDGLGPLSANADTARDDLRSAVEAIARGPQSRGRRYRSFADALEARRAASPDVGPDVLHAIVERNVRAVGGGYDWATDARLRIVSPQRFAEESVSAMLARVTAPTLMIVARQGFMAAHPKYAARIAALRDPRVVELDGGHHLHTTDQAATIASHMDALCRGEIHHD